MLSYVRNSYVVIFSTSSKDTFVNKITLALTGYLGREKGKDWKSDRFYFLRDLPTNPQ
ncbi:hypothetical protein [Nodularia sp. NIES-3585]|uniref:hypothetical protein n=1 Tax=Nodularia sp. NIES-3585 TaxID=1973477 RepID=UPI000B6BEF25|nr:hypothetical protein [Nodularia sp. NIES-3585]GAX35371.1 hypothetical protein NIES3585_13840 [Nodularia sp. NIES-3585]